MRRANPSSMPRPRPDAVWRRASASVKEGYCVEVLVRSDVVDLRDSKDPQDKQLRFDRRSWAWLLDRACHSA
jgi:hypothetical protein